MKFCVLASGSGGNATWIEEGDCACLVDNGLSFSEFKNRIKTAGLDLSLLRAVFVTHEHGDHLNGVGPLARGLNIPVYASPMLLEVKGDTLCGVDCRPISFWEIRKLGDLALQAVPSSHDTVDPFVFLASGGGKRLGIVTDLGCVSPQLRRCFNRLDSLILEFNHDEEMLKNGPYPPFLKKRILGPKGHLSNKTAAAFLSVLNHQDLKNVVVAHISKHNNTPDLAEEAALSSVRNGPGNPRVHVADQFVPTAVLEI
ncbi:MAG: MBL fold metallo-hydrolase [Deltaproteobacteria bacterium]|jgi:phosphoribosyl 1,2-cyclic phosphodiesterase|nr:MBL fold metallo-hydrolase [Deltaproteobacteria bacterium]